MVKNKLKMFGEILNHQLTSKRSHLKFEHLIDFNLINYK